MTERIDISKRLTQNDVLFLETVDRASRSPEKPVIVTSKLLLSEDLLSMFTHNNYGFWCFGVYVEFQPSFLEKPAEEWQKHGELSLDTSTIRQKGKTNASRKTT